MGGMTLFNFVVGVEPRSSSDSEAKRLREQFAVARWVHRHLVLVRWAVFS